MVMLYNGYESSNLTLAFFPMGFAMKEYFYEMLICLRHVLQFNVSSLLSTTTDS